MSEYQYYEFLAVDRPLTAAEQAEVRPLSTRARITATSFTNPFDLPAPAAGTRPAADALTRQSSVISESAP